MFIWQRLQRWTADPETKGKLAQFVFPLFGVVHGNFPSLITIVLCVCGTLFGFPKTVRYCFRPHEDDTAQNPLVKTVPPICSMGSDPACITVPGPYPSIYSVPDYRIEGLLHDGWCRSSQRFRLSQTKKEKNSRCAVRAIMCVCTIQRV